MKTVLTFIFTVASITFVYSGNGNDYFYNLNEEISIVIDEPEKINAIYERELKKYKESHNLKYSLSSKYVEMFFSQSYQDRLKQIPLVYELLKLNNDKYEYISIACNFNLSLQFEHTSPQLSLKFLDQAIKLDEKLGKRYFLPHLYHVKGRLYFNKADYNSSMVYFNKALETYKKEDKLYIASMHNNFALCWEKLNNYDKAIEFTRKGIEILQGKTNLNLQGLLFFNTMKINLGSYYLKLKKYVMAENLFVEVFEFHKSKELEYKNSSMENSYYTDRVNNSQNFLKLYRETGQKQKQKEVIEFLKSIEGKIKNIPDRIKIYELAQGYYFDNDDLLNSKLASQKLIDLNNEYHQQSKNELELMSNKFNEYVIENIDYEYNSQIADQKQKNWILSISILLAIIIFTGVIINIRNRNRREIELAEKQKLILQNNKTILEQDLQLHKEKIKNLNLNLNLKIETEKAFLENLKKIRRLKNIDTEQTLKDLFFKINNLMEIDKKNYDFINESSLENKIFMEKLSQQFPILTKQELKLCVYFKLNLSSKEISLLENITSGSVRVYKTKIKSKMRLGKEVHLNEFLNSL